MKNKSRKNVIAALGFSLCLASASITANAATLSTSVFDPSYYYNSNPDLQAAYGYDENALLNHYLTFGLKEGRSGSAEFNAATYKNNYSDLSQTFGNDYLSYCYHYMNFGKTEGRNAASPQGNVTSQASTTTTTASTTATVTAPLSGTVLASYSTNYDATIPRATNIAVAVSRINGIVIQPNASFSFSQTILPRTTENGYVVAPVFVNKKVSTGVGGGICQVSSTLYAALLSAGIPATERYAHSLPVSYIPSGMDATISGNSKDLKFTNTTNKPITISASTNGGNGTLTITLLQQ